MNGQINGLKREEANDFIKGMNYIEGVNCAQTFKESVIEFKSIFTPIIIEFVKDITISLVACYIYDFLKKEKEKNKKISITINNINIYQNENKEIIENKLNNLIEGKDKNE